MIEFAAFAVEDTREISQDIYVDLDREGRLVSMTIEHARTSAGIKELSFQELGAS